MTIRRHDHEEWFPAAPEKIFSLLCTPSAIRSWWGAARAIVIAQRGGSWTAAWGVDEDAPDYVTAATLQVFEPPRRLVMADFRYYARQGPLPFTADFITEFTITAQGEGAVLRVVQDGFPADSVADPFYEACHQGWRATFAGIRCFLTEG